MALESPSGSSYDRVIARSGGRCEAMRRLSTGAWTRCGKANGQIHHMLKRSRGGTHLDDVGEIYHLIVLCHWCHQYTETSGEDTGMLIDGYAIETPSGVVYYGSDEYLKEKYGENRPSAEDS